MSAFVKLNMTRLQHRRRSQLDEMLLDQVTRASCACGRLPNGDGTR